MDVHKRFLSWFAFYLVSIMHQSSVWTVDTTPR
jgi:hypothetical protein